MTAVSGAAAGSARRRAGAGDLLPGTADRQAESGAADRVAGCGDADLHAQIREAARAISPLWPLSTAVAVNPLWDLRDVGFEGAVAEAVAVHGTAGRPGPELFARAWEQGRVTAADLGAALATAGATPPGTVRATVVGARPTVAERHDAQHGTAVAAAVDREVAIWCAAYAGRTVTAPAGGGLYATWRALVADDTAARRALGRVGAGRLTGFGDVPEEAVLAALDALGVPDDRRVAELAGQLARLPGWAGHAKWRTQWAAPGAPGPALHLVDFLAVRLAYEAVFVEAAAGLRGTRRRAWPSPVAQPGVRAGSGWDDDAAVPAGVPDALAQRLWQLSAPERADVWLRAYEGNYRDELLGLLAGVPSPNQAMADPPAAQVVCCIDVRSEGLRRHLEAAGAYQTFGFAGFFGLPVRFRPLGSADDISLLPVLLQPEADVHEVPAEQVPGAPAAASRHVSGRQALDAANRALGAARDGAVAPFALAEAGGLLAAPLTLLRTLSPSGYRFLRDRVVAAAAPDAPTEACFVPGAGMSDDEQARHVGNALTAIGLTAGFAPLVVLCGHGSTTENNPHASALDCGACGGNRGAASARAVAGILNRPAVRARLLERGIAIPDDTVFVAAEHDTTTDAVHVLDRHLVPATHHGRLDVVVADLQRAGVALAAERTARLPGAPRQRGGTPDRQSAVADGDGIAAGGDGAAAGGSVPPGQHPDWAGRFRSLGRFRGRRHDPVGHVAVRAADWAQVQPEWGLATNAAFIVGPRSMTADADLGGRCFLHSYDAALDPDGTALQGILTAPMVVAHWINAQYYFSTVDPAVFSCGDKVAHNVLGDIGVLQGAAGDLGVGLPLQSVVGADGRPYHEPMRLLTVVQAPRRRIDAVIGANAVLQELFDGGWVHLVARDGHGARWWVRRRGGGWEQWCPAGAAGRPAVPAEPAGGSAGSAGSGGSAATSAGSEEPAGPAGASAEPAGPAGASAEPAGVSAEPAGPAEAASRRRSVALPHARVAMVGAGQLARMTHQAAIDYGVEVHVLAAAADQPAVAAGAPFTIGRPDRLSDLQAVARHGEVLTFDHELVPSDLLLELERAGHRLRPNATALRFAQDKLHARSSLSQLGPLSVPVPSFAPATTAADVCAFAEVHGWPVVAKARGGGYDGRGVHVLHGPEEAQRLLPGAAVPHAEPGWVVEEHLALAGELAVIVARRVSGEMRSYPPIGTRQEDGMCRELVMPAATSTGLAAAATALAESIVAGLDATGVCAVELFVTADGRLLLNELALRPHNAGHITMEACVTSQFHQHLRAVLDWPLGSTEPLGPAATVNVVGADDGVDPRWRLRSALEVPGVHAHLYGKTTRPGRKLGHVTALGSTPDDALAAAREAAARLQGR